jgi:hypothetical protein
MIHFTTYPYRPEIYNHTRETVCILLNPKDNDFKEKLLSTIDHGFGRPVMISRRKIGEKHLNHLYEFSSSQSHFLCLHRLQNPPKKEEVYLQVRYCLYHFKKKEKQNACKTQLAIEHNSLDYLYKQSRHNKKEISGTFKAIPIHPKLLKIKIDGENIKLGDAEKASIHKSVGSYHTHPYEAYKRHEVCVAFPSLDDYLTTLYLYTYEIGVFHVLSSIEGIYLISVKPSFFEKYSSKQVKKDRDRWEKYVSNHYDDGYPECSIDDKNNKKFWKRYIKKYIRDINRKKIFNVQFKFWEDADEPFYIDYHRIHGNCIITDDQYKSLNHLLSLS